MSKFMSPVCFRSGGIEEAGEEEIFPAAISTREMHGELLM